MRADFEISQRESIKAGLRTRGITLAEIAEKLGILPATVSGVIAGRRSARVERKVAEAIDTTVYDLFPERIHQPKGDHQ